jgi:hypothetical protein
MIPRRSAGTLRRGWIVVGATFITLAMVYGIWYSYSVFRVAFLRKFGWGALSDRVNRDVAYSLAFACVVGGIVAPRRPHPPPIASLQP